MVLPVSGSKTGMARWSSDVSGVHHSASNYFRNFRWAACASITVRACFSCNCVRLAMGCSVVWYWEWVRRPKVLGLDPSWGSSLELVPVTDLVCAPEEWV